MIVLLEGRKVFYHDIFYELCITRNDSRFQKFVVSDVRNIVEFAVRNRNENEPRSQREYLLELTCTTLQSSIPCVS